jgi:hypothetical protein
MGNQAISGIAALVVLTFVALALAACSTPEHRAEPIAIAPIPPAPGTSEFHGAAIGADTLRSRLASES